MTWFTWSFERCISLWQRLNGWQDIKINILVCSLPHKHRTLTNTTHLVSHFYVRAVTAFVVSWISKAAAAWFTQSTIIHPYFRYIVPCNFKPPAAVAWFKKEKRGRQIINNWTLFKVYKHWIMTSNELFLNTFSSSHARLTHSFFFCYALVHTGKDHHYIFP